MRPIFFLSVALGAMMAGSVMAASGQAPASNVLYNQNSNFGYGVVSQNFTSGSFGTAYNAAAADDFIVPTGTAWTISEVDVTGSYFEGSGPAASEVVTFYANKHGRPDRMRASYTLTCADNAGSFACQIPGRGIKLSGGTQGAGRHYWISVVANCNFESTCGEWNWTENTVVHNNPGMWENPGGGFGIGCTTWTRTGKCIRRYRGDYAFALKGSTP